MPRRCPAWGVVIEPLEGKPVSVASRETEILRIFANRLAQHSIFFQLFHRTSQNWLPFYWNGFKQTARFTYLLEDIRDLERVWDGMTHNIRSEIRKAENRGLRVIPCDVDEVFEAEYKTFAPQNLSQPGSAEYLRRLFSAGKQNNSAECFAAVDSDGRVHAANMIVWDSKSAYFFAGGADPELRTSGATSLLVWGLIQFASQRTRAFDFCGSVVKPIERFFRAFGGRHVPCYMIMKFPSWLRAVLIVRGKM